jgi:cellobiose-specific phosphotransferase system component IIA
MASAGAARGDAHLAGLLSRRRWNPTAVVEMESISETQDEDERDERASRASEAEAGAAGARRALGVRGGASPVQGVIVAGGGVSSVEGGESVERAAGVRRERVVRVEAAKTRARLAAAEEAARRVSAILTVRGTLLEATPAVSTADLPRAAGSERASLASLNRAIGGDRMDPSFPALDLVDWKDRSRRHASRGRQTVQRADGSVAKLPAHLRDPYTPGVTRWQAPLDPANLYHRGVERQSEHAAWQAQMHARRQVAHIADGVAEKERGRRGGRGAGGRPMQRRLPALEGTSESPRDDMWMLGLDRSESGGGMSGGVVSGGVVSGGVRSGGVMSRSDEAEVGRLARAVLDERNSSSSIAVAGREVGREGGADWGVGGGGSGGGGGGEPKKKLMATLSSVLGGSGGDAFSLGLRPTLALAPSQEAQLRREGLWEAGLAEPAEESLKRSATQASLLKAMHSKRSLVRNASDRSHRADEAEKASAVDPLGADFLGPDVVLVEEEVVGEGQGEGQGEGKVGESDSPRSTSSAPAARSFQGVLQYVRRASERARQADGRRSQSPPPSRNAAVRKAVAVASRRDASPQTVLNLAKARDGVVWTRPLAHASPGGLSLPKAQAAEMQARVLARIHSKQTLGERPHSRHNLVSKKDTASSAALPLRRLPSIHDVLPAVRSSPHMHEFMPPVAAAAARGKERREEDGGDGGGVEREEVLPTFADGPSEAVLLSGTSKTQPRKKRMADSAALTSPLRTTAPAARGERLADRRARRIEQRAAAKLQEARRELRDALAVRKRSIEAEGDDREVDMAVERDPLLMAAQSHLSSTQKAVAAIEVRLGVGMGAFSGALRPLQVGGGGHPPAGGEHKSGEDGAESEALMDLDLLGFSSGRTMMIATPPASFHHVHKSLRPNVVAANAQHQKHQRPANSNTDTGEAIEEHKAGSASSSPPPSPQRRPATTQGAEEEGSAGPAVPVGEWSLAIDTSLAVGQGSSAFASAARNSPLSAASASSSPTTPMSRLTPLLEQTRVLLVDNTKLHPKRTDGPKSFRPPAVAGEHSLLSTSQPSYPSPPQATKRPPHQPTASSSTSSFISPLRARPSALRSSAWRAGKGGGGGGGGGAGGGGGGAGSGAFAATLVEEYRSGQMLASMAQRLGLDGGTDELHRLAAEAVVTPSPSPVKTDTVLFPAPSSPSADGLRLLVEVAKASRPPTAAEEESKAVERGGEGVGGAGHVGGGESSVSSLGPAPSQTSQSPPRSRESGKKAAHHPRQPSPRPAPTTTTATTPPQERQQRRSHVPIADRGAASSEPEQLDEDPEEGLSLRTLLRKRLLEVERPQPLQQQSSPMVPPQRTRRSGHPLAAPAAAPTVSRSRTAERSERPATTSKPHTPAEMRGVGFSEDTAISLFDDDD